MNQSLTDALTKLLTCPPSEEEVLLETQWLNAAAVLIPVLWREPTCPVVMTRRAVSLRQHGGEICLPGGKIDANDKGSVIRASLREAEEELGLRADGVSIRGCLPKLQTSSGQAVYPVLGLIDRPPRWQPQATEVSQVLKVPLALFMHLESYRKELRTYRGHVKESLIVTYNDLQIWGLTARIMFSLRQELLKGRQKG